MRIAVFFPDTPWISWSLGRGLPGVLKRMGHDVLSVPVLPALRVTRPQYEKQKAAMPSLETLSDQDAILFSGPEHVKDWVHEFLKLENIGKLTVPKFGWYHDSLDAHNFENFKPWIDRHFMADPRDAGKHKGEWLPAGVDAKWFNCGCWGDEEHETMHRCELHAGFGFRSIPCASICRLNDKRQDFLKALNPLTKGCDVRVGNCVVTALDGIDIDASTELLANTLRRTKAFLHLPNGKNTVPAGVLEAMACGAYTIAAQTDALVAAFPENGPILYNPTQPDKAAKEIKEALQYDTVRTSMARKQCEEINKNHRIEPRLEKMLSGLEKQHGSSESLQSALAQQPA